MCKALHRRLQRHIYAIDLRNHGDSAHTSEMSYELMAADIDRFIRRVALANCDAEGVHLLGHSMGGKVVALVALDERHATTINTLIVEDVTPKSYVAYSYLAHYLEVR